MDPHSLLCRAGLPCRFDVAAFEFGVTAVRLVINYDEGKDTPTPEEPSGVGLVVLDNIVLNGHLITAAHQDRE
jgi:hypothetical protein